MAVQVTLDELDAVLDKLAEAEMRRWASGPQLRLRRHVGNQLVAMGRPDLAVCAATAQPPRTGWSARPPRMGARAGHGSRYDYQKGCRCRLCTGANNAYLAGYKRLRRAGVARSGRAA